MFFLHKGFTYLCSRKKFFYRDKRSINKMMLAAPDSIIPKKSCILTDFAEKVFMFVFLLSNCGNLISPSRLTQILGVKSSSTVLDYLSYFETSYMLSLVPFFSWSQKSQQLHPKKSMLWTRRLFTQPAGLIQKMRDIYWKT